jgi:1-deoxy-D-xylulose-5-phosphate reductoisomerase
MADNIKRLAVLGSTGSIGRQTLDVVRTLPGRFRVVGLAAGRNLDLLEAQVREFHPDFIGSSPVGDDDKARLEALGCRLLTLEAMVCHPDVDVVVVATSGRAGLSPTLAAVRAGKHVALANKEALVAAGEIITGEALRSGARILPVDSEHSAVWQCLNGEPQEPRRIILTASGGPFRDYTTAQMEAVTVEQALRHPSWQMGRKVTVDSATLMNKGLEVIEARWLFHVPIDSITVVIHPQSIIHSMVEFIDGSVKAQLSCPDMRLPIQYALSYPDRIANPQLPSLDWGHLSSFTFEQPDLDKFPCLKLAITAGKEGGTFPAVLCAADEVAVGLFLSQRLGFMGIPRLVKRVLAEHSKVSSPTLEEIIAADAWARERALKLGGDRC